MSNLEKTNSAEAKPSWISRVGFPDRISVVVVGACVVGVFLVVSVVPSLLRNFGQADLRGVPARTSFGVVDREFFSVNSGNGATLVTTVQLSFAGTRAAYRLPLTSKWRPTPFERVRVTYRVGRRSGLVHVDSATPSSPRA